MLPWAVAFDSVIPFARSSYILLAQALQLPVIEQHE